MARHACDRAAALIQTVAGGTVYHELIDVYPKPRKPTAVNLRRHRIKAFLGAAVQDTTVEQIFNRLGFQVNNTQEGWNVEVPSHRIDIIREEDLLDEIARHYGFDKFPATLPEWSGYGAALPTEAAERLLRNQLAALGYSEIMPLVFSDALKEQRFRPNVEPVRLLNPMAEDEAILRTSQVPSMLRTIEWNLNRGIRQMQLYELGKIYRSGGENRSLILAATGVLRAKTVHELEREFNFFDLKGDVEAILERFDIQLKSSGNSVPAYYHPGRSFRNRDLATFGELHPDYAEEYKFRNRVYIAEIDVEMVLSSNEQRIIEAIPKFPSIRRDFSLLLRKGTRYVDVEHAVLSVEIPELARIEPFDRLETGPFADSKYALAISITYRSPERTLTDHEVDNFDKAILNSLKQRLGAELRQ